MNGYERTRRAVIARECRRGVARREAADRPLRLAADRPLDTGWITENPDKSGVYARCGRGIRLAMRPRMLKKLVPVGFSALVFLACAPADETGRLEERGSAHATDLADSTHEADEADVNEEVDEQTRQEALGTRNSALGRTCYCSGAAACGHSSSPSYMYGGAHAAMLAAGVTDASLTQTYGDAPASVGTHCPEPGKTYSAATDLAQGADPCGRTRKLRAQGFAAWFRTAPEFPGNLHIHAVYAGAPGLKASLQRQVASFLDGRDGLAGNRIDAHCPITEAEKAAVRKAQSGGGAATNNATCVTGGAYCGGDKLDGDTNTLYRCNGAAAPTVIEVCANGCSVSSGRDDSCNELPAPR
jgi:hypothetical protein